MILPEGFTGEFAKSVTTEQKRTLIRVMAKRVPSFAFGVSVLNRAGVRDKEGLGLETEGDSVTIKERSFRPMAEHGVVVALAADSLSDLLTLDPHARNIFVLSALLHDATKRVEVAAYGYRKMNQTGTLTPEATAVMQETLTRTGVLGEDFTFQQAIAGLTQPDMNHFLSFFDSEINRRFLVQQLKTSRLTPESQHVVVDVASSDTFGSIPFVISALSTHFTTIDSAPEAQGLFSLRDVLARRGNLPPAPSESLTRLLSPALSFCDDTVKFNKLVPIDQRINSAKPLYNEVNDWGIGLYGIPLLEAQRIVMHAAELFLIRQARLQGTVPASSSPKELPKLVFENLQRRIN